MRNEQVMSSRRSLNGLLIAVVLLLTGGFGCSEGVFRTQPIARGPAPNSSPAPRGDDPPATPGDPFKHGRHGLLIRCAGAPPASDNRFHVTNDLRRDPYAFFAEQVRRARRMRELTGHNRIVFHMLNGWDREGMPYSSAVLGAMPVGRRDAFTRTVRTLRDEGFDVGVYLSCQAPRTPNSITVEEAGPLEPLDLDNPRHREVFVEGILEPLIAIGVNELWFDNASTNREPFAKLAEALRPRGIHVVMEAAPTNADGSLDLAIAKRIASASMDRFVYRLSDQRGSQWVPLPKEAEVIVIISTHQTVDNTVPDDAAERRTYLKEQMQRRMREGFTLFNMELSMDEAFFAVLREARGEPSAP